MKFLAFLFIAVGFNLSVSFVVSAVPTANVTEVKTVKNVADYGAVGDCVADDYDAIRAAINDVVAEGGGTVYFPPGCFGVGKHERFSAFRLNNVSDVTFRGEGRASVIRILPGDYGLGDFAVFSLTDSSNQITFEHFSIDGNRDNVTTGEQGHLFLVWNADNITIRHMHLANSNGDCVKLGGTGAPGPTDTPRDWVYWFRFEHNQCLDSRRNGITVQRANRFLHILDNQFSGISDSSIDFEPSGYGGAGPYGISETVSDTVVTGNVIEHSTRAVAVSLGGNAHRTIFSNNLIMGGRVFAVALHNALFEGNMILGVAERPGRALDLSKAGDNVIVRGNHFRGYGDNVVAIYKRKSTNPGPLIFEGNTLIGDLAGINILGSQRIMVVNNQFTALGPEPGSVGINVEADTNIAEAITLRGNDLKGFNFGIKVYAKKYDMELLEITHNVIDQCIDCIRIINGGWNGSTFTSQVIDPLIKDNRIRQPD